MRLCSAAALAILLLAAGSDSLACGDKFLVPSRGPRFAGRPVDRAAAAVLVYARLGSSLDPSRAGGLAAASLRAAGYRLEVVTDPAELRSALARASWDAVLIDLADLSALDSRAPAARSSTIVPVARAADGVGLDDARRRYRRVLTAPRKPKAFVDAIDFLVATRVDTGALSRSRD